MEVDEASWNDIMEDIGLSHKYAHIHYKLVRKKWGYQIEG